jgi:hypothetical protein
MMNQPLDLLISLLQASLLLSVSYFMLRLWKEAPVAFFAGISGNVYFMAMTLSWLPFSYTATIPFLLLLLCFLIRSPFLVWLTRGLALATLLLQWLMPTITGLFFLLPAVVISGYLLIRLLREPLYQDDIAFGKSLLLAGSLFWLLTTGMLLILLSSDDLLYSTDARRIAIATHLIWQAMLLTGLYKFRKGKQEKTRYEKRVWKEEPESFRFL